MHPHGARGKEHEKMTRKASVLHSKWGPKLKAQPPSTLKW
jgi:hypothetical protein